jgi:hypothetical protein
MPKKRRSTELRGDSGAENAAPIASPMDKFKSLAKRLLVVSSDDMREARALETETKPSPRSKSTK